MKINLLGYGKMGHIIEELAQQRGHTIVHRLNAPEQVTQAALQEADAAIEFSTPHAVLGNIHKCLDAGVPVVVGTTGWHEHLPEVKRHCIEREGAIVYASNFSLGVNMLFAINEILARWMSRHADYTPGIHEVHHVQKMDHPSGTAITLAEGILKNNPRLKQWQEQGPDNQGAAADNVLPIYYERKENVPGFHKVTYTSDIDTIEISHNAHNRKGFALGAVMAAEFIIGKKGVFTAKDIFNFSA